MASKMCERFHSTSRLETPGGVVQFLFSINGLQPFLNTWANQLVRSRCGLFPIFRWPYRGHKRLHTVSATKSTRTTGLFRKVYHFSTKEKLTIVTELWQWVPLEPPSTCMPSFVPLDDMPYLTCRDAFCSSSVWSVFLFLCIAGERCGFHRFIH
jgi:hypothetical protein